MPAARHDARNAAVHLVAQAILCINLCAHSSTKCRFAYSLPARESITSDQLLSCPTAKTRTRGEYAQSLGKLCYRRVASSICPSLRSQRTMQPDSRKPRRAPSQKRSALTAPTSNAMTVLPSRAETSAPSIDSLPQSRPAFSRISAYRVRRSSGCLSTKDMIELSSALTVRLYSTKGKQMGSSTVPACSWSTTHVPKSPS